VSFVSFDFRFRAEKTAETPSFKVDYEKFTLPNGLEVIFHVDRSDPVVAVNLTAHVGSAREKAGAPDLRIFSSIFCFSNRKIWAKAGSIK
jgi:predicted Zn-dependent peptidase